jgi:hypothetical protein
MNTTKRHAHWDNIYTTKEEAEVSWFQEGPEPFLELIEAAGATLGSAIIDIGGDASRLVDTLVSRGYAHLTVLDLSEAALTAAQRRIGEKAPKCAMARRRRHNMGANPEK